MKNCFIEKIVSTHEPDKQSSVREALEKQWNAFMECLPGVRVQTLATIKENKESAMFYDAGYNSYRGEFINNIKKLLKED